MSEKNSKATYSEQLDTIADWEWFIGEIPTSSTEKNLIETARIIKLEPEAYCWDEYKEYEIVLFSSNISLSKLIGAVVFFDEREDEKAHWEWMLDFYLPSQPNTSLEFRGHIQETPEKACELMLEAALIVCQKLDIKFPQIIQNKKWD
jgi:hypothetical protein